MEDRWSQQTLQGSTCLNRLVYEVKLWGTPMFVCIIECIQFSHNGKHIYITQTDTLKDAHNIGEVITYLL